MKTSKRILSFFMAVVMAITACSAGFVAFAREVNPKDNSPFSDKYASADKSVDALDGLLDSLLPIILEALDKEKVDEDGNVTPGLLSGIGIDVDKVINAEFDDESIKSDRFYEFMQQLSAYLFTLIGKTDMETVLKSENLSSGNEETDAQNYAYLNDEDATFDFWSLYTVVKNNAKADGTELQQLCYKYYNGYTAEDGTEVTGLRDLLYAYAATQEKLSSALEATMMFLFSISEEIGIYQEFNGMPVFAEKSAEEINALIAAYEAENGEIPLTGNFAGADYDLGFLIKFIDNILEAIGSTASCETAGDVIFHFLINQQAVMAADFCTKSLAGGAQNGLEGITYDNWFETLSAAMSYDDFKAGMFDASAYPGITEDFIKGIYRQTLAGVFYQTAYGNASSAESSPYYTNYVLGFLANNGYITKAEAATALTDIENSYVTDAQIQFLLSSPAIPAYDGSQGGTATTASTNTYGNSERLRNLIAYDLCNQGFSPALRKAFADMRLTSGSSDLTNFNSFRSALRSGDANAFDKLPGLKDKIIKTATLSFANQYTTDFDTMSVVLSKSVAEYSSEAMQGYSFEADNYPIDSKYFFELTASTIDGYITMAKDLNKMLNDLLGVNLDGIDINEIVNTVVGALAQTKDKNGNPLTYDLIIESVDGIYTNLAKDPIGTIANVLPVLMILIDEILFPLIINGEGDAYNGFITTLVMDPENGLLASISESLYGTIMELLNNFNILQLSIDLNITLPALTDFMATGGTSNAYGFYESLTDSNGQPVPIITAIGVADKWIADNLCNCKFADSMNAGLGEIIRTVIGVLDATVVDYVNAHNTDATADANLGSTVNGSEATLNKGLNNISVALPSLIDGFVKNLIKLYNANDSDWSFDSRIKRSTGSITDDDGNAITYGTAENVTLSNLKSLIFTVKEPGNSTKITSWLVELLISDWLNAIIDLVNDALSTDNDISNNIPIIASLLAALGGFGEESIISDVFNSFFYLTRNSQYSFALAEREIPCSQDGSTYVGFSEDSAYFLVANLGPIINIVMDIINANKSDDADDEEEPDLTPMAISDSDEGGTSIADLIGLSSEDIDAIIADAQKLMTKQNAEKAQKIVDSLDAIISTLLENTYLNGFQADKLDGILAGVVTFLVNHFGEATTDKIMKIVRDYLEIICHESIKDNFAPKRNTNSNGPVDDKKVYSKKELSVLVTETYALLEEILDSVINIKGDDNDYIVNAIDGIYSPSSIAIRSNLDDGVMNYITWCELSASKYATDLGFSFTDGNKEDFYKSLFNALGPIAAIFGTLLGTTGYYDNVVAPIFSAVADSVGFDMYAPADASNEELMMGLVQPIAAVLNSFLKAPINTLVSLVTGLITVLEDDTVITIVNGAISPLANEITGLGAIVEKLSPTFATSVASLGDKLTGVVDSLPEKDVIITLLNNLLGIELPTINFGEKIPNGDAILITVILVLDIVLKSDLINGLIAKLSPQVAEMLGKLDAGKLLNIVDQVLSIIKNPTEFSWTFEDYLAKATNSFKYPTGITAAKADDAVDSLDALVENVFPLLQSLGVLDYEGLPQLVNGLLFKNDLLTKIATGIYGAIEKAAKGKFVFSPAQFAEYLMDSSYGNTYSSAAAQLKKCSSWSQVKDLNWGFTDGSAKAEQGFINGLAALCRPINDLLALILAQGDLELGTLLNGILSDLAFGINGTSGDLAYSITLKDSELNIYLKNTADGNDLYNRIQLDIDEILAILDKAQIAGSNGYQCAIIPLLEALMCDNVKTYDEYIKDYNKAKDNLIIDILNPLFGFVDKVLEKPFDTITAVLPNVAYFIDNNGIGQFLNNLLAPITQGAVKALKDNGIDIDQLIVDLAGTDLGGLISKLLADKLGVKANVNLRIGDLNSCNIQDVIVPLINAILKNANLGIVIPDFKWSTLASHGTQTTFNSAAGGKGIRIIADQGELLVAVLRYISDTLIINANAIKNLLCGIEAIAKNKTIVNILTTIFNQLSAADKDEIVNAVFYLLVQSPQNAFFDYRNFKYTPNTFAYPSTVDVDFLTVIGPMLDGLIGGLVEGGLNQLIGGLIYKDSIISSLVCGLYGAVEGVKINDNLNLAQLLAQTDIDFTTDNVAKLLTDKSYGQTYSGPAKIIEKAGSWSKVNKDSLSWGVTDRDSFVHALCAALRPIYGVLDVLLNNASLGLFDIIYLPGSDGYTSAIVPLMEAFGLYNIKTQYQYRQDMSKEYDAILLDILNPLLDKVEDILNAPIQMVCDILPNLSLFFANDGLLQLIDNLLLPITALLDALKPIVDVNDLLKALGLDVEKLIGGLGLNIKNFKFDIYNLSATLKPLIGADNIVGLLNSVLGLIKIKGTPLGIKLMPIDWFQLASHGEVITNEPSQAATFGARIYVKADPSEVLIAVLRYLINTINYDNNFNTINDLIGGLIGGASSSISDVVSQVLGMLSGDTDEVISSLCELLQTLA